MSNLNSEPKLLTPELHSSKHVPVEGPQRGYVEDRDPLPRPIFEEVIEDWEDAGFCFSTSCRSD